MPVLNRVKFVSSKKEFHLYDLFNKWVQKIWGTYNDILFFVTNTSTMIENPTKANFFFYH